MFLAILLPLVCPCFKVALLVIRNSLRQNTSFARAFRNKFGGDSRLASANQVDLISSCNNKEACWTSMIMLWLLPTGSFRNNFIASMDILWIVTVFWHADPGVVWYPPQRVCHHLLAGRSAESWATSQWTQPPAFSRKHCNKNGRRIAIPLLKAQGSGAPKKLRYKLEVLIPWCLTMGHPSLKPPFACFPWFFSYLCQLPIV